jgi:glycosyltransferase involved in cell wall biosynthesis
LNIVHTESSCGWGGQEIRVIEESLGLQDRGHKVSIVCPRESNIYREGMARGLNVHPLPIAKKGLSALISMASWLLVNKNIDVVNTHSSTDSWLVAVSIALCRLQLPVVRTRHISSEITQNWPNAWLYKEKTSHIVTTGEIIRSGLVTKFNIQKSKITSVPTGISEDRFYPRDREKCRQDLGLEPNRFYFGILATLRSWKGHLYLLDAFKLLREEDTRLLIIGDGPMREQINRRISDLGLQHTVMTVGQKHKPELWLNTLDVFCLPSYANEGIPQAILQAMFTALPIVTTSVGGIPEVIVHQESGLLARPRDSENLALNMRYLYENASARNELGQRARLHAQNKYSRFKMLDSMEEVFTRVILRGVSNKRSQAY